MVIETTKYFNIQVKCYEFVIHLESSQKEDSWKKKSN